MNSPPVLHKVATCIHPHGIQSVVPRFTVWVSDNHTWSEPCHLTRENSLTMVHCYLNFHWVKAALPFLRSRTRGCKSGGRNLLRLSLVYMDKGVFHNVCLGCLFLTVLSVLLAKFLSHPFLPLRLNRVGSLYVASPAQYGCRTLKAHKAQCEFTNSSPPHAKSVDHILILLQSIPPMVPFAEKILPKLYKNGRQSELQFFADHGIAEKLRQEVHCGKAL